MSETPVRSNPRRLVLVDSSAWLDALIAGGVSSYREALDSLLAEGRVATCEVVVAEVLQAAQNDTMLDELATEIGALSWLSMEGVGRAAAAMGLELRRRGLVIPTTDLLIAATAHVHGVPLLHRDQHLSRATPVLGIETLRP